MTEILFGVAGIITVILFGIYRKLSLIADALVMMAPECEEDEDEDEY